jgi:hypothetical protein
MVVPRQGRCMTPIGLLSSEEAQELHGRRTSRRVARRR